QICQFFEDRLGRKLERENDAIAEAVSETFPVQMQRLRAVLTRLNRLPAADHERLPAPLAALERALEDCYRHVRRTDETVQAVKRHLDVLNDGVALLAAFDAELTDDAIEKVRAIDDVVRHPLGQLEDARLLP